MNIPLAALNISRKPTQQALAVAGLIFASILVGYALPQDVTSPNAPVDYITVSLTKAHLEVERLTRILNNYRMTPQQKLAAIQAIAGSNKQGVRSEGETDPDLAVVDLDTLARMLGRDDPQLQDEEEGSSGGEDPTLAGLPDVPSIGYTVNDITYAGFEPKSINRNLNESNPAKAGKDWVYRYLVNNKIDPNSNWAQAAADALNRQYNTDVFRALDGQTLVYGDERVRTTPVGYGLTKGQYDPGSKGQFHWASD